ncbi:MAG: M23 family metallopeptidase [Sphingomonadaceae bacterium]
MVAKAMKFPKALAMAASFAMPALVATPVYANSSAASADMVGAVRDAKSSPLGSGDDKFRKLFSNWQSMDNGQDGTPVSTSVSIPSIMPVDNARLSSGFGMRTHPVLGVRRGHKGIDLAAPTGTPIYASADGVVSRAVRFSSYGLYISMEHGAGLQTRYGHLSKLSVAAGERVKKGEIIGYVGSTGRSTGPHLHYEVRVDGVAVNPLPYMTETQAQKNFAAATSQTEKTDLGG